MIACFAGKRQTSRGYADDFRGSFFRFREIPPLTTVAATNPTDHGIALSCMPWKDCKHRGAGGWFVVRASNSAATIAKKSLNLSHSLTVRVTDRTQTLSMAWVAFVFHVAPHSCALWCEVLLHGLVGFVFRLGSGSGVLNQLMTHPLAKIPHSSRNQGGALAQMYGFVRHTTTPRAGMP